MNFPLAYFSYSLLYSLLFLCHVTQFPGNTGENVEPQSSNWNKDSASDDSGPCVTWLTTQKRVEAHSFQQLQSYTETKTFSNQEKTKILLKIRHLIAIRIILPIIQEKGFLFCFVFCTHVDNLHKQIRPVEIKAKEDTDRRKLQRKHLIFPTLSTFRHL